VRSRANGAKGRSRIDLDLLAIQRKVQSRADPDFEHPPAGGGNHLAAIFLELVLPHDQIKQRRKNPAVIEIHENLSARQRPAINRIIRSDRSAPSTTPLPNSFLRCYLALEINDQQVVE
jgi:hypothetical protein